MDSSGGSSNLGTTLTTSFCHFCPCRATRDAGTTADPGYLDLVIAPSSAAFSPTSFSLSASVDRSRIMINGTATLSGSISNTGGSGADSLGYTLGVSVPSSSGSFGTLSNSSGTLHPGGDLVADSDGHIHGRLGSWPGDAQLCRPRPRI